jgi:hypothetical protein
MHDDGRTGPAALFAGDLSDPWVADLAASLPPRTARIDCPGALPDRWPGPARVLVLHRSILDGADAERLRSARRAGIFERLILCLGPHARYHQVQRWAPLATAILPEATAAESLPRYLAEDRAPRFAGRLIVVSTNRALRDVLAAACRSRGGDPAEAADWSRAPTGPLAVWDVPVLEPSWPRQLAAEASRRRVVALLGFPDRATVRQARRAGAAACLESPCDPADLAYVLGRIIAPRAPAVAGSTPRPLE